MSIRCPSKLFGAPIRPRWENYTYKGRDDSVFFPREEPTEADMKIYDDDIRAFLDDDQNQ